MSCRRCDLIHRIARHIANFVAELEMDAHRHDAVAHGMPPAAEAHCEVCGALLPPSGVCGHAPPSRL